MDSLENKKNRALKMMLWFGIGSLIMTFAGLTSAFLVSKNRDDWVEDFNLIMSELMSDSYNLRDYSKDDNEVEIQEDFGQLGILFS